MVTSPLSRCLETASGIFGYEKVDKDSELLKRERVSNSEGSGPSHPNFYKSKSLPIVAQELCRECLLGVKYLIIQVVFRICAQETSVTRGVPVIN